jgi:hypothetical protein
MDNIYEPTADFPFSQISMTSPTSASGGIHFSKLLVNKLPIYIQTPKCKTKQGIVKSGKKMHSDLVFTNDDEEFIQWLETLETTVRKLIYDNRTKWFDTELTEEDVESYFTPTVKLFKSGKMYLVRVNASSSKGNISSSIVLKKTEGIETTVKIYDENENDVAAETIDEKTSMITIVEVQGIRCSAKSFQIDIELKQIMILKPVDLFQKCVIKTKSAQDNTLGNPIKETLEEKHDISSHYVPPIVLNVDLEKKDVEVKIEEVEDKHEEEENEDEDNDEDEKKLKPIKIFSDDVLEVNLDTDELNDNDTFHLKEKTEVYYEMYREARRKAKLAKSLALSSFMEARRIKNLYMLDDVDDSDSDLDDLEEKDA